MATNNTKSKIKTVSLDFGANRLTREAAKLKGERVEVGIQENAEMHKDEETGKTTKMVIIAATHEFGTSKAGRNKQVTIPKRSFIRSTVDENQSKWQSLTNTWIGDIIDGNLSARRLLTLLGLTIQTGIQNKIRSNIPPKLTTRQGTALWNTGQLINEIRYATSLGDEAPKKT